ncbi:hypothetical protein PHJA_002471300 [Phtheirospermum japonicum]|uniref:Eukaryotic translation initiation factor 4B n=1 Tax=Phtheirospermum japonicum TaxID=374723 RepID=A0A830D469_9LAMI|nr:hypothetical protein PHJA_002471300 [Phtheirospermum japonicum]
MSKSPWGNIGAWAADAERAEAEEREAAEKATAAQPPPSFPSLKESVGAAAKQKKKTKMTLQELRKLPSPSTYSGSAASRGLTHEELLRLPTGPKERSADDMQTGRLGGGFSNYGNRPGSGGSNQGRGRDYEGRRSYGFQDDDRSGGPPRVSEMNQHSRADEVANWASTKKPIVSEYNSGQSRPGGKYSSLGGGGGPGAASRADDADNWASVKKTISQPQPQTRSSSFGSGFSRPESDRWTRNEHSVVSDAPKFEVEVVAKVNKPNPFGTARPREEVLAEKGLDWKKLDSDIEGKKLQNSVSGGSRPASSQSSRPESPLSSKSELSVGEGGTKQKPKVNPFGNAKPREVLLEEKGLDWKKIDLNLENRRVERSMAMVRLDIYFIRNPNSAGIKEELGEKDTDAHCVNALMPETEEEKNLEEEIERLKKESQEQSGDEQTTTHNLILQKEQELETLVRQLDDKVRYSQKNFERQGSGVGRGAGFYERPPSRPGAYDEPPRAGFQDRPPSYDEPRGGGGYQDRPRSRSGMMYDDRRANFGERPPSWRGGYDESRPGSRERPHSRQGPYDETRNDYNERPHSRGTVDSWSRGSDDRGAGQGGGGRGFFGSRDTDRYFSLLLLYLIQIGFKVVNFVD